MNSEYIQAAESDTVHESIACLTTVAYTARKKLWLLMQLSQRARATTTVS